MKDGYKEFYELYNEQIERYAAYSEAVRKYQEAREIYRQYSNKNRPPEVLAEYHRAKANLKKEKEKNR